MVGVGDGDGDGELASDQSGCNVRVAWLVGPVTYELDHPSLLRREQRSNDPSTGPGLL